MKITVETVCDELLRRVRRKGVEARRWGNETGSVAGIEVPFGEDVVKVEVYRAKLGVSMVVYGTQSLRHVVTDPMKSADVSLRLDEIAAAFLAEVRNAQAKQDAACSAAAFLDEMMPGHIGGIVSDGKGMAIKAPMQEGGFVLLEFTVVVTADEAPGVVAKLRALMEELSGQ